MIVSTRRTKQFSWYWIEFHNAKPEMHYERKFNWVTFYKQIILTSVFRSVYDSLAIRNAVPYMNVLKDHWNKHQNRLFHFDLGKFPYLVNSVGSCIFYMFQWKPDIFHLISSKPTVMKWVFCQNFSVTGCLNCNAIEVWKITTKRIFLVI